MAYIGKQPGTGVRNRLLYTATSGQTTFTTSDSSQALSYSDGLYVDVYLNGVLLDPANDYTATSGTSIVLGAGASAGDVLEVGVYDVFSVFDGTVNGDLTVTEDLTISDKIIHSGDTNTAIRFAAADTVTVETGGSEAFRIDSSQNVGIGTTPASGVRLDIRNNSTTNIADLRNSNSAGFGLYVAGGTGTSYYALRAADKDNAALFTVRGDGATLVGKTTDAIGTAGHTLKADGFASHTRDGDYPLGVNRLSDDGDLMKFFRDGSEVAAINVASSDNISFGATAASGSGLFYFSGSGGIPIILPAKANSAVDNEVDLGRSSQRFQDIFASNGTIQTSDQNEKQDIASLTSAEITAAKAISKLFKTFKWKDRVASKGDSARTHAGVIAQEVQSAMSDAGLDVTKYAFWCSDTFWEKDVEVPAVEADEENGIKARDAFTRTDVYETEEEAPEGSTKVTRLSIRYPELLAFVGAATEQRLADIETRLAALEAG